MKRIPEEVAAFLEGKRLAVAGVSRHSGHAANAVFRKLRDVGYEVIPINPNATELEGVPCYANVRSVPESIDGVVVVTHPSASAEIVRQCGDGGIQHLWLHRSFGHGSVSTEAVNECKRRGIECIVGGCPLMYCEPIDFGHRCMRSWLGVTGRVPR